MLYIVVPEGATFKFEVYNGRNRMEEERYSTRSGVLHSVLKTASAKVVLAEDQAIQASPERGKANIDIFKKPKGR